MRSRYLYGGIVIAVLVALFLYRTNPLSGPLPSASLNTATFGGVSLNLEFATTTAGREKGLGDRASLADNYGMLFVFPKADRYGFWMKDTLVPLDMFWLDDKGRVVYLATKVQPATYPHVFYPPVPALYVLETAAGFARAHGIATGTPLDLQKFPTVSQ
jgi:uncharacterized membrane protein (UPF0127 family)